MPEASNSKPAFKLVLKSVFKSVFRWEAFTALALVLFFLFLYVAFFLEVHLKWIAEKSAFESLGTEVNIERIEIDFFKPHIKVKRIQVTNPDKPEENSIEIGHILVSFSYAPLLRQSFVSELTNILGVRFHSKRERAGKVLPKEKRLLILKDPSRDKIHKALEGKFKKTAFSDLADLFREGKSSEIEKKYKEKLESLKVAETVKEQTRELKAQLKSIEEKVESPEVKNLLAEVKAFRFKSDSTSDSLESATQAFALLKKLKKKKKEIEKEVKSLKTDSQALKNKIKSSPSTFLKDSQLLKSSLDPNQLSPEQISEEILSDYFSIQLAQVDRVTSSLKKQALGDKAQYIESLEGAASSSAPDTDGEEVSQTNLEKRKKEAFDKFGQNIIFYKKALLPKFWFKKIVIFSRASDGQDFGDVSGYITNFSAAPELVDLPMVVKIKGSVPKQGIGSFKLNSTIDHRDPKAQTEKISLDVGDYIVKSLKLFGGSDEWIKVLESNAETHLNVLLQNQEIKLKLKQTLKNPVYSVYAKDKHVESFMKVFKETKEDLSLSLNASGALKKPNLKISSNLGRILKDAVQKFLSSQVSALASKELSKLNGAAAEKLAPYLKDVELTSVKASDLNSALEKEIDRGLKKLKKTNGKKEERLEKKLLKSLFKKL